MKINIKAFAISFSVVFGLLILVISIWSRVSLTFGKEFMVLFTSVHPNPFYVSATNTGLGLGQHIAGVAFDVFYAIVDSLVFSLGFSMLYNKIVSKEKASIKES